MTQTELILLNFTEISRRSTLLWKALPQEFYGWKPDNSAMTALEMIRHVLQADYGWNMIISQADMSQYKTPWQGRPLTSVGDELEFAERYRKEFLNTIKQFSDHDLANTQIIHPGNGEKKMSLLVPDWYFFIEPKPIEKLDFERSLQKKERRPSYDPKFHSYHQYFYSNATATFTVNIPLLKS